MRACWPTRSAASRSSVWSPTGEPSWPTFALGPQITVAFRAGWRWATVEGHAELIGPDDRHPDVDTERLRTLLREIFVAAGGAHDDWDAYDRAMVEQRRTAVLITPSRIYSN